MNIDSIWSAIQTYSSSRPSANSWVGFPVLFKRWQLIENSITSCFVNQRFTFTIASSWLLSFTNSTCLSKALTDVWIWIKGADSLPTFLFTFFFSFPISLNFLSRLCKLSSSPSLLLNQSVFHRNRHSLGTALSSGTPPQTILLWSPHRWPLLPRCRHRAYSPTCVTLRSFLLSTIVSICRHCFCQNRTVLYCLLAFRSQNSTISLVFSGLITVLLLCFDVCCFTQSCATKYSLELFLWWL